MTDLIVVGAVLSALAFIAVACRLIEAARDFPHAPSLVDREPQRSAGEDGEGDFGLHGGSFK